jgi:hypothetical protein
LEELIAKVAELKKTVAEQGRRLAALERAQPAPSDEDLLAPLLMAIVLSESLMSGPATKLAERLKVKAKELAENSADDETINRVVALAMAEDTDGDGYNLEQVKANLSLTLTEMMTHIPPDRRADMVDNLDRLPGATELYRTDGPAVTAIFEKVKANFASS